MTADGNGRISFGIVGGGWRSGFFLRIARALPDRFEVVGVVTRTAERGAEVEAEWSVPTFRTVDELLRRRPEFVVVSVLRTAAPGIIEDLADRGVPVLTETPPAPDVDALAGLHARVARGAIIQVAEQYHLSPLLNAQLAIAKSGRLGAVSQATVAQCHDYHGVSVLRRALGVGFEDARVTAAVFRSPLVKGPDRHGDPKREETIVSEQITARLEFGDRLGVYDFATAQYFSWIRGNRLLIRGDRGEVSDLEVRFLKDFRTPMFSTLRRVDTGEGGNLQGRFLRGLIAGDEWVYRSAHMPGRLNDDELAIADLLVGMSRHIEGGPPIYSLSEASQDLYLSLLIKQAAGTGEPVTSSRQVWAD